MSWRRRVGSIVSLSLTATIVLLLAAATMWASPAGAAVEGRTDGRLGTDAAQSFVSSPTYSTLTDANGYEELWSIPLQAGQQLIVNLFPSSGEDLDLALWGPETTEVTSHSQALDVSWQFGDKPEAIKYVVPAGGAGTYYIDVWSSDAPAGGYYWYTVNVQSPGGRASITPPAVKKYLRTGRWYTAYGTLKPLHFAGDRSVKVVWQKYYKKRWRAAGNERPYNLDYRGSTRYRVKIKFYGWGKGTMRWRVRAIHLKDELHPRRVSAWRYFYVKN